jgi:hypothetical protein
MRRVFASCLRLFAFSFFCHAAPALVRVAANARCAAEASSSGGTTERHGRGKPCVVAHLIWAADADGNSDHSNAMAPVTNGTATLVPERLTVPPSTARLVIRSPGALKPRAPIELPRFDSCIGRLRRSHATTGMTHG